MTATRQIRQNAAAVAAGLASDWHNAYLIACSVALNEGSRSRARTRARDDGKVSGNEFARLVAAAAGGKVYGMGPKAIVAALTKWDRVAAEAGLPTSDTLTPADASRQVDYPDRAWYEQDGSPHVARSKEQDIAANPAAVARAIAANPDLADRVAADPDSTKALNEAVMRTDAGRAMQRSIERGRRQREAREDDAPKYLRSGLRGLGVFLELGAMVEEIVEECVWDDEGARAALLIVGAMEHEAKVLRAWAEGAAKPPSDEEFDREVDALLRGDPS